MKKILIYIGAFTTLLVASCTKDFDEVNTNPTQASSANFDPNLLLPTAEVNYVSTIQGYSGALLFQSMWVQIFANAEYPTYYSNGDKYVASGNILTYAASIWNNAYQAASKAKEIQNLIVEKGMTANNLSSVALIVQLLNLELVTDVYGDCPYSQALQAKTGNIAFPGYDKQSNIYPAMLNSLDSAISTLDPAGDKITNDIIYKGDITKWKKFGYSLMLRMAMRLTKVDAATAQKYAEKAYAGGAFSSVDDNAYVTFDNANGYGNANASALQVPEDFSQVRWSKPLIDFLKASGDPRVPVIAEIPKNGTSNNNNKSLDGDHTFSRQIGMPNGYDQNGGATDISNEPNYPGVSPADPSITGDAPFAVGLYSRPTAALYTRNLSTPGFILTYAETELLFAEAAVRGWSVGATATQHYHNGVSAALQSYGTLNSVGTIAAADAEAYATAHPLNTTSTTASLSEINTQFWATTGTLFNFIEAWNNWRRSGYPLLTPVNYVGNFTSGQIPRRETYPSSEVSNNGENYNAASSEMGGDTWISRVWWDTE
jgi:hypothetical protein